MHESNIPARGDLPIIYLHSASTFTLPNSDTPGFKRNILNTVGGSDNPLRIHSSTGALSGTECIEGNHQLHHRISLRTRLRMLTINKCACRYCTCECQPESGSAGGQKSTFHSNSFQL